MRIRSFLSGDEPAVLDLWNRCMGGEFPLDSALFEQNVLRDAHFDPEAVWVAEGTGGNLLAYAHAKVCKEPLGSAGMMPEQGWIGALAFLPDEQGAQAARQLLHTALEWLRTQGRKRVNYGSDPAHLFPGVPVEQELHQQLLQEAGFVLSDHTVVDLIRDLADYRVPDEVEENLSRLPEYTIRSCTAEDVPALLRFLQQEFPGRWYYETVKRLEAEETPRDILLLTHGEEVVGFCHTFHRGSRRIGPSIYWRKLLGEAYGGLGPIGVAASTRGKGLGLALLCKGVEYVKAQGASRMAIDWTDLVDFYGRIGFRVWKRYRSASRQL
ncbi:MAG: GNAT family N-acetyltransferase [Armatimonadota bacterium]|nr:GNAT family N-acetyltransferase [Armatimonadota bacterium]